MSQQISTKGYLLHKKSMLIQFTILVQLEFFNQLENVVLVIPLFFNSLFIVNYCTKTQGYQV